ncbi:hypothetical protein EZS27_034140, partial [termite gut metagenome]
LHIKYWNFVIVLKQMKKNPKMSDSEELFKYNLLNLLQTTLKGVIPKFNSFAK